MLNNQNKLLIERLFNEAMNERKLTVADQLIAPEFVNHGIPDARTGPTGFKDVLQQFLDGFPDMQVNIEHIISDEDLVATRGYWTGTHKGSFMDIPSTGKKVNITYIDFWKIKNGKIVENWVQMDMNALMAQLGVAHAPETA